MVVSSERPELRVQGSTISLLYSILRKIDTNTRIFGYSIVRIAEMESKIIVDGGARLQFEGRAGEPTVGTQGVFGGMGSPVAVSREKENSNGVRAIHFIPYTNGYYNEDEGGMSRGKNGTFGASQKVTVHKSVLAQQNKLTRDNGEMDRLLENIGSIISDDAVTSLKILFDQHSLKHAQKGAPLLGSGEDEEFWLGCFGHLPNEARDECILKGFGTARYTEIKLKEEGSLERYVVYRFGYS